MSRADLKLGAMRYVPPPISATLEGGDFDGKTITLPQAFRGVDIEKEGKAARYRFAARKPDGSYTYEFTTSRRRFHVGAAVLPVGEGVRAVGLGFYPSAPAADQAGKKT
jgi:hypothetical protein